MDEYFIYKDRTFIPDPTPKLLYRIPHDIERTSPGSDASGAYTGRQDGRVRDNNTNSVAIPEPFRANPDSTIPVKNYPIMIDLLCQLNPSFTRSRAEDLLGTGLCWCNREWGVFHAPIITGGAILEAEKVEDGKVYFKSIVIDEYIPTLPEVLSNHLSAIATSVNRSGEPNILMRESGTIGDSPVRMFIVSTKDKSPLWFYENSLHKLPAGFEPPSPIWMP